MEKSKRREALRLRFRSTKGVLPLWFLSASLVFLAASCASTTVYNIDLAYIPTGDSPTTVEAVDGPTVTVALFNDERTIDDPIVIGRVVEANGRPSPILPQHREPCRAVVQAVSAFLTHAGYRVAPDHPPWDLREESIDPSWGKILLGGTINELFIECDRSRPLRRYSSRVNLTFVLADVKNKSILHRVTVDTAPVKQHLRFSEIKIEEELSNTLSQALEKAFAESDLPNLINGLRDRRNE